MAKIQRRAIGVLAIVMACASFAIADGKLVRPRTYDGSLEETAQEAILIFQAGDETRSAHEDLVLKVTVRGGVLSEFAWVIPFPAPPDIHREDAVLFRELFNYVAARRASRSHEVKAEANEGGTTKSAAVGVDVISRRTVGSYDTAVVRETERGALNRWLHAEGFRPLENADDVLDFYRGKDYLFACIKVSDVALAEGTAVDLHPLRFSFDTKGRDGVYFPMKMTGLQSEPFHVNLYVFHRFWLNDHLSRFGYEHRGFRLHYRDWDSSICTPNAGKTWTAPESDPFLKAHSSLFPTVTDLLRRLHPGERYYLTNIQAADLRPADVRQWTDDLWLFPYYTNRDFVPYDARPEVPTSAAEPDVNGKATADTATIPWRMAGFVAAGVAVGLVVGLLVRTCLAPRTGRTSS